MKTNQKDHALNSGYYLVILIIFAAFSLLIAGYIGDFTIFLSSIGESHLMKRNH